MAIASRVKWYLDAHHFDYEEMPHVHTWTSLQSARAGKVFPEFVAKAVLLEDECGYVVAVLRASDRISLHALEETLSRRLELATEPELCMLFQDCERGAVPPLGSAYNLPVVVDERLLALPTVYFEAGDHEDLVSMEGEEFARLMSEALRGRFAEVH